jgi:[glutamine synthetase] adenylyltransferase / [glutamine synthetase]-adenylyl-L-tyrosine phosphorylase
MERQQASIDRLAADPEFASTSIEELRTIAPHISELSDEGYRRLVLLVGASRALADHLNQHPEALMWLEGDPTAAIRAIDCGSGEESARLNSVRETYRHALVAIAASDLSGHATFDQVSGWLSAAAARVLEQALISACRSHPEDAERTKLAIIAMGKTGGNELNYISDVDVIFVAEPTDGVSEEEAMRSGSVLASTLMRFCEEPTSQGALWPVDAGLRPEGRQGPLVRTVESHLSYYQRWAKTWEFQALVKARAIAGDVDLGERYIAAISPLVWTAADRENFVADVQAMRRRVEEHIPVREAARQIKLGVGGLRDVEFAVQLLQLVHGKGDSTLRTPNTLAALAALREGGFVGREDADALTQAYIWLRTVEHRIQLHRLRRTHLMPESESDVRRLSRSMGFASVDDFMAQWRETAALIRRIHEKLFYRPLLMAVARLGADEQRLTPAAAKQRLAALGYVDAQGALLHLEALSGGVSRRAAIQRTLLPAMLGWFADGPDPDAGLLGFRQLSDALGETPWYLRTLRDSGTAAQRLALILSSSRYATELLLRAPEAAALLEDDADLRPRGREALLSEARIVAARYEDSVSAIEAVRAVRRRELFRTAVADLLGVVSVSEVGQALSDVASATLHAALDAAIRAVESAIGRPLPTSFAIIAMGRLGGAEMGYPSDADVLFVHEALAGVDEEEATSAAMSVAAEVRRLCALPSPEPPLLVDADLRPEGRDGPLVRSLGSYAAYYEQWGEGWERQALLRATYGAGDHNLAERFLVLINEHRYLPEGVSVTDIRELRRIKARVEAERLPRGADPSRHVKLGPGGLSDVEWLAQLMQMQFGYRHPELQVTSTLDVLHTAEQLGLITAPDAKTMAEAWRLATRIRNATMLVRGKPGDELPRDLRDLRAVALVLGMSGGGDLVEHWQSASRRARMTFDRLFFDA